MAQEYIRTTLTGDGRWPYTTGGILFKDDIEGIFGWSSVGTGSGYTVEHSMTYAFEGDYSMHLKTRTTGALAGDVVQAYRRFGLLPEKSLMLSAFYFPFSGPALAYLYFEISHHSATLSEVARLRYDYANSIWQYYNTSGTYSNISGSSQSLFNTAWHSFAMSANFYNNTYISLISDGIQVDLSDYSYYQAAAVGAESIRIWFQIETVGAAAVETYFDNITVSII